MWSKGEGGVSVCVCVKGRCGVRGKGASAYVFVWRVSVESGGRGRPRMCVWMVGFDERGGSVSLALKRLGVRVYVFVCLSVRVCMSRAACVG